MARCGPGAGMRLPRAASPWRSVMVAACSRATSPGPSRHRSAARASPCRTGPSAIHATSRPSRYHAFSRDSTVASSGSSSHSGSHDAARSRGAARRPSASGDATCRLDARTKRTASWSGMRRWPPGVRSARMAPPSIQRFTLDSLAPSAAANCRGESGVRGSALTGRSGGWGSAPPPSGSARARPARCRRAREPRPPPPTREALPAPPSEGR